LTDDRCPICGVGTLIDMAFDGGGRIGSKAAQTADSRQVVSYSCGHTSKGPRLDTADEVVMEVERRTSKEVTDQPLPEE
jgi:hypothetical protein